MNVWLPLALLISLPFWALMFAERYWQGLVWMGCCTVALLFLAWVWSRFK